MSSAGARAHRELRQHERVPLHFGLMDSPQPLTADNLLFVIDTMTWVGNVTPDTVVAEPPRGPRSGELPLLYSAVDFPEAPPS